MWRFRRIRLPLLVLLLVVAALTVVVQLRKHAPPEAARLLPGADAFVYVDLKWARAAAILKGLPAVKRSPDYDRFVAESGVDFERDLEEAALAVHYPGAGAAPAPGKGGIPSLQRYSAVLTGQIDAARLGSYFRRFARSTQTEQGVEIYTIPLQEGTLRAAILGPDMVALSNCDDAEVMRGVVVRSRKRASPFGGPSLLRAYYKRIPLASLAWAIAKFDPKVGPDFHFPEGGNSVLRAISLKSPAVVVASARLIRAVHFRAEAFTANEAAAHDLSEELNAGLALFRLTETETPSGGPDADVKAFFDSLKVTQSNDRAVLTGAMPVEFLKKVFQEPGDRSETDGSSRAAQQADVLPKAAPSRTGSAQSR